jgi:hypothetical protein
VTSFPLNASDPPLPIVTLCGIAASALVNTIWKAAPARVLKAVGAKRKSRASMARRSGAAVGLAVGLGVGLAVGLAVGLGVGLGVDAAVGPAVGVGVDAAVGLAVGADDGELVGADGGLPLVTGVGSFVGVDVASASDGCGLGDAGSAGAALGEAAADPGATDAGAQAIDVKMSSTRARVAVARGTGTAAL